MRLVKPATLRNAFEDEAGYTLTEMLIVILIIALIASVLTPSLLGQLSRAKAKTAALQLDTTAAALVMFKEDVGRLPTRAEGLNALVSDPGVSGWTGPYAKSDKAIKDPWGRPLVYTPASEDEATLTCLGADGKPGGTGADADITVPVK